MVSLIGVIEDNIYHLVQERLKAYNLTDKEEIKRIVEPPRRVKMKELLCDSSLMFVMMDSASYGKCMQATDQEFRDMLSNTDLVCVVKDLIDAKTFLDRILPVKDKTVQDARPQGTQLQLQTPLSGIPSEVGDTVTTEQGVDNEVSEEFEWGDSDDSDDWGTMNSEDMGELDLGIEETGQGFEDFDGFEDSDSIEGSDSTEEHVEDSEVSEDEWGNSDDSDDWGNSDDWGTDDWGTDDFEEIEEPMFDEDFEGSEEYFEGSDLSGEDEWSNSDDLGTEESMLEDFNGTDEYAEGSEEYFEGSEVSEEDNWGDSDDWGTTDSEETEEDFEGFDGTEDFEGFEDTEGFGTADESFTDTEGTEYHEADTEEVAQGTDAFGDFEGTEGFGTADESEWDSEGFEGTDDLELGVDTEELEDFEEEYWEEDSDIGGTDTEGYVDDTDDTEGYADDTDDTSYLEDDFKQGTEVSAEGLESVEGEPSITEGTDTEVTDIQEDTSFSTDSLGSLDSIEEDTDIQSDGFESLGNMGSFESLEGMSDTSMEATGYVGIESIADLHPSDIDLLAGRDTDSHEVLLGIANSMQGIIRNLKAQLLEMQEYGYEKPVEDVEIVIELKERAENLEEIVEEHIEREIEIESKGDERCNEVYTEMTRRLDEYKASVEAELAQRREAVTTEEVESLKRMNESLQKEYEQLQEMLDTTREDYTKVKAERDDIEDEYRKFKQDSMSADEGYHTLHIDYERLKSDKDSITEQWGKYKEEHEKLEETLQADLEGYKDKVQVLERDSEIMQESIEERDRRLESIEKQLVDTNNQLHNYENNSLFNIVRNIDISSAVQTIVPIPSSTVQNVRAVFAGNSATVDRVYGYLKDMCKQFPQDKFILIDLSVETYMDLHFGYMSNIDCTRWFTGKNDLDDVLARTNLPNVMALSLVFSKYNDNALVTLDWENILEQLRVRTETVIINFGNFNTFANSILFNSMKEICRTYIFVDGTPCDIRNFRLRYDRFIGLTQKNNMIVKLFNTVDDKSLQKMRNLLEACKPTSRVKELTSAVDIFKL